MKTNKPEKNQPPEAEDRSASSSVRRSNYLRYDIQGADFYEGIKEHPFKVMEDLGITFQHATPHSNTAQWLFWNCENIPEKLPKYLDFFEADPMEYVGFGLDKEEAEKIKNYCA